LKGQEILPEVKVLTTNKYFSKFTSLDNKDIEMDKLMQLSECYRYLQLRNERGFPEEKQGVVNLDYFIK